MEKIKRELFVAIDFDGTISQFYFPKIGKVVPGADIWIPKFVEAGAKIILWTMRSYDDKNYGDVLTPAINWCKEQGIEIHHANLHPTQDNWTSSPKVDAITYIDDKAFGCPLIFPENGRPYVNWEIVGPEVLDMIQYRTEINKPPVRKR